MLKCSLSTVRIRLAPAACALAALLIVTLATAPAAPADAVSGARIELKTAVSVDRESVRLSDLASIHGAPGAPLAALGETAVAQAPLPGKVRFLDRDAIRLRLRQAGHDMEAIEFSGAVDVRVTRQAAMLPAARVRSDVEAAIRQRMPWPDDQVAIRDIRFDEDMQLPTGRLTYRFAFNRNEDFLGRTIVALNLFIDGEPFRRIWVNAVVSVMAEVVTVVRPLGKQQTIAPEDLALRRRELATLPSDVVRRMDAAIGNRTTRMIYPDTVLQTGMFVTPPLVRRGDIVKIIARSGPLTVTATGEVKEPGAKGELVRVINTDSNRSITARVTATGAVEVEF